MSRSRGWQSFAVAVHSEKSHGDVRSWTEPPPITMIERGMELNGHQKKRQSEMKLMHAASVRNVSILSFGYLVPELRQKHAALSKLGYKVLSHSDFQTVCTLVSNDTQKFTFFLIGPAVPEHERRKLAELYRAYHPRGNVVFFYRGSIRNGELATALLNERNSPENLLNFIRLLSSEPNAIAATRGSMK